MSRKKIIIVITLLINLGNIYGNIVLKYFEKYDIKYLGEVEYDIDTMLVLYYGNRPGELPFPKMKFYHGPFSFDIDDNSAVYIFDIDQLRKYDKTGILIWRIDLKYDALDFKYYRNKVYLYAKDKLIIYNSENGNFITEESFGNIDVNKYAIGNLSFFCNDFLFLRDVTLNGAKLRYIYSLEKGLLSKKIRDERDFSPIYNCEKCDFNFIRDLYIDNSNIHYLGQSKKYVIFSYMCAKEIDPEECPDGDISQFYLFQKETSSFKIFNPSKELFQRKLSKVDLLGSRQFVHKDSTIFVFQTLVKDLKRKPVKLIFYMLKFKKW